VLALGEVTYLLIRKNNERRENINGEPLETVSAILVGASRCVGPDFEFGVEQAFTMARRQGPVNDATTTTASTARITS
jgi:hypothetical protein